jgi:ribonucleoside-diphosphate reductase alpha chain
LIPDPYLIMFSRPSLQIERRLTQAGGDAYAGVRFVTQTLPLDDEDHGDGVDRPFYVPAEWDMAGVRAFLAAFALEAVPSAVRAVPEDGVPSWLCRRIADEAALQSLPAHDRMMPETSLPEIFDRIAGGWTYGAWQAGLFASDADAKAYYDELRRLLAGRYVVPDPATGRALGAFWAYGVLADAPLFGSVVLGPDPASARLTEALDHALQTARLAEVGVSVGRHVDVGGDFPATSSMCQAILRAGGVGGASGSVSLTLDADHEDAFAFVATPLRVEAEATAARVGQRRTEELLDNLRAAVRERPFLTLEARFDPNRNRILARAIQDAEAAGIFPALIDHTLDLIRTGQSPTALVMDDPETGIKTPHMLRLSNRFLDALVGGRAYQPLTRRGVRGVRRVDAHYLWDRIATASWFSGDPVLVFEDTVQDWNGMGDLAPVHAATQGGAALLPDRTASPHAILNLMAFRTAAGRFDSALFAHSCRLLTIALETSIRQSGYPSEAIQDQTQNLRPIGLSFTNLAAYLVSTGLAYDSADGRATAGAITAVMTASATAASAELAAILSPFPAYDACKVSLRRVLQNQRRAVEGEQFDYDGLSILPQASIPPGVPDLGLIAFARHAFDQALALVDRHGLRHAQLTALVYSQVADLCLGAGSAGAAPMDCFIVENGQDGALPSLAPATLKGLQHLAVPDNIQADILRHTLGTGVFDGAPGLSRKRLEAEGFDPSTLARLQALLPTVPDVRHIFTLWSLGPDFCLRTLGISEEHLRSSDFDILGWIGFRADEIAAASRYCCGTRRLDDAPALTPAQQAVFRDDIGADAQLRLYAALQPFLSGGIGQPVRVSGAATVEDCNYLLRQAWQLGLKTVALYRPALPHQNRSQDSETAENAPLFADLPRQPNPKANHLRVIDGGRV